MPTGSASVRTSRRTRCSRSLPCRSGPGAAGIQVAKLGEAEVFAHAGLADIFIGYPLVGGQKVARLIQLLEGTDATISVAADSMDAARPIAKAAAAAGLQIPLLIEVDTGLRRLGVQPHQPPWISHEN